MLSAMISDDLKYGVCVPFFFDTFRGRTFRTPPKMYVGIRIFPII